MMYLTIIMDMKSIGEHSVYLDEKDTPDAIQRTTRNTRCAPAVLWLLGCSALRAKDPLRPAKRELGFAGLGEALRAH